MNKKIGILGSGAVAKVLAKGFLDSGCEVKMGTRDVAKLQEWILAENFNISVGSFADAAIYGETIVLAVKGTAVKEAIELAGIENFAGKTVIDTSNPIAALPPVNGVLQYFTEINNSLMEQLQNNFPSANFVKCFNMVGNAFMVNPPFATKPTMFICGNNDDAKTEVKNILTAFGWEAEDMGKAEAARAIEPLCMLWCIPGFLQNQWTHAFKLLKI